MNFYKDPELDHKPEQLQQRGEPTIQMRLAKRLPRFMQTKIPRSWSQPKNEGAVPDLPADCVVEVTAYVGDKVPAMWLLASCRLQKKAGYK